MDAFRLLATWCMVLAVAYGPFYRYVRGLVDSDIPVLLAYLSQGVAFGLGCILIPSWWRRRSVAIDRSVLFLTCMVGITAVQALLLHSPDAAVKIVRSYLVALGAYWVARSLSSESVHRLLALSVALSVLSIPLLIAEFLQVNVLGIDPRDSMIAIAYTRSPDFDPREYAAYFSDEAWRLPLIGYLVRPFGSLGGPQVSGLYYAFMFWIAFFALRNRLRIWILGLLFAAAALTVSRTGVIAIFLVWAVLLVTGKFKGGGLSSVIIAGLASAALAPSFASLFEHGRDTGILNAAVFAKDVIVFIDQQLDLITGLDLPGLLFGIPLAGAGQGFDEGGVMSVSYYSSNITDTGLLSVISEIGWIPFAAFVNVLIAARRIVEPHGTNGTSHPSRNGFVVALASLMLLGSIHYIAVTIYCLNIIIMLTLAWVAFASATRVPAMPGERRADESRPPRPANAYL